ncbi:hypothetical protein RHGRI_030857 [Rhododendron griersonianum]|uniref:Uncharacterized protein n=1 Tax=Rhododendron griersonianum TaxID=479676 RepID=A0AAV6I5K5_9ERIC|nr:hypothetical protein RHGRI_030857 [Rhododendron griersonianum]
MASNEDVASNPDGGPVNPVVRETTPEARNDPIVPASGSHLVASHRLEKDGYSREFEMLLEEGKVVGTANTPLLLNSSHDGGGEEEDGKPVTSVSRAFGIESKKLWKIAGPTITTAICQYTLGALTQTFAGFVGELELAAVGIENSVVAGLAFGVMVSKLLMSSTHSATPGNQQRFPFLFSLSQRRNRDDEIHRRLDIKSRRSSSMGQNYIEKAAFLEILQLKMESKKKI